MISSWSLFGHFFRFRRRRLVRLFLGRISFLSVDGVARFHHPLRHPTLTNAVAACVTVLFRRTGCIFAFHKVRMFSTGTPRGVATTNKST